MIVSRRLANSCRRICRCKHREAALVGGASAFCTVSGFSAYRSSCEEKRRPEECPKVCKCKEVKVVEEGHPEYIEGIRIWGVGIKQDPVPGEKRGKGVQHLRSNQWMYALAKFIQDNYKEMCVMITYAREIASQEGCEGYDYRYFINCSEGLFHKALHFGLKTKNSRELLLMASWCLMAAAEVADHPFYDPYHERHTAEWRREMREVYGLASCRFDLIPAVALERLDIHNELCVVKWKQDPGLWLREGFLISSRVDSMLRHFWSIHARDWTEDHIAHGIWNLMSLYHVLVTFPEKNDLTDFSALGIPQVAEE